MADYDFSGIGEAPKEEPRPGLCIAKCCGNCAHFWYHPNKPRRGFCKMPNPQDKAIDRKKGERYNEAEIRATWLRSHFSNVCDLHRFRSKYRSIGIVSQWVGKVFKFDGSLDEEQNE